MAEYIVEFDRAPYDQMVADGILKETDNPTLYGMPVYGEIVRCRNCSHFRYVPGDDGKPQKRCAGQFAWAVPNPNGFCFWAKPKEGDAQ